MSGDSSTWIAILYEGADPSAVEITGDRTAAERLIAAYEPVRGLLPAQA